MRLPRRLFASLLALLCAGIVAPSHARDAVAVILSESGEAYGEAAEALRQELDGVANLTLQRLDELDRLRREPWKAWVAVGTDACGRVVASRGGEAPVLCTLLPSAAFAQIVDGARKGGPALAAVVLDQPPARQLALIRIALPERRRLGVLLGPESISMESALAGAAAAQGLRLHVGRVQSPDDLGLVLQQQMVESDVLLTVPDGAVINSRTLPYLLRFGFRNRIPLIAFSAAYVRAGALLAVYSTPAQIGRQTGQTLREVLAGRAVPGRQPPREFEVLVNNHVARSLGVEIEDGRVLAARLRQREAER